MSYINHCANEGQCRSIKLAEYGINIGSPALGTKTVVKVSDHGIPSILHYKCCVLCKLPANLMEAVKLNQFLGNKVENTPTDPDFLRLLNEQ